MIEEALRYQTEGDDWVKRIAIGGGLLLFSIFLIPVFTVLGYLLEVVRNALRGDVEQPPKWGDYDLVDLTINGLKAFVILFVYSFVVSIISWVPLTLLGAIGDALDIGLFALLGTLVYLTLSLVGGLAVAVITPVALSNFVLKEEISAGFDINVMKNIIPEIAMLRAVGIGIVIYLITAIASGVVSILVITALIVPFILFVGISGIALVWGQGFAEAYETVYGGLPTIPEGPLEKSSPAAGTATPTAAGEPDPSASSEPAGSGYDDKPAGSDDSTASDGSGDNERWEN